MSIKHGQAGYDTTQVDVNLLTYAEMTRITKYLNDTEYNTNCFRYGKMGCTVPFYLPQYEGDWNGLPTLSEMFILTTSMRKMLDGGMQIGVLQNWYISNFTFTPPGEDHDYSAHGWTYKGQSFPLHTRYYSGPSRSDWAFWIRIVSIIFTLGTSEGVAEAFIQYFANMAVGEVVSAACEQFGLTPVQGYGILMAIKMAFHIYSQPPNSPPGDYTGLDKIHIKVGAAKCDSWIYKILNFQHSQLQIGGQNFELGEFIENPGVPNGTWNTANTILQEFDVSPAVAQQMKDALASFGANNVAIYGLQGVCHIYTELGLQAAGRSLMATAPNGWFYAKAIYGVNF